MADVVKNRIVIDVKYTVRIGDDTAVFLRGELKMFTGNNEITIQESLEKQLRLSLATLGIREPVTVQVDSMLPGQMPGVDAKVEALAALPDAKKKRAASKPVQTRKRKSKNTGAA